jgi:TatD DNase family protein
VIDFHCHLDLYPDPAGIAEGCRERNMYVLSVTTTPSAWKQSCTLGRDGDRIRTALGLHPQIAHQRRSELALFDELLPQTRYVGEVGLDGGREYQEHWPAQTKVFDHVLTACQREGGRILSIHSRRAAKPVLNSLSSHVGCGTAVLHWFSGTARELDDANRLGCWFSVGPAMLRNERGRVLVSRMPRDRILTETDGPFAQTRGRPLLPWDVKDALRALASLWNEPLDQVEGILSENLRTLTKKATSTVSRLAESNM